MKSPKQKRKLTDIRSNMFRSPLKLKKCKYVSHFCDILNFDSFQLRNRSQNYYQYLTKNDVFRTVNSKVHLERYLALVAIYISYYEEKTENRTSLIKQFLDFDETRVILADFFQLYNCCFKFIKENVDDEDSADNEWTDDKSLSHELIYWISLFKIFSKRLNFQFQSKDWWFFLSYIISIETNDQKVEGEEIPPKLHEKGRIQKKDTKRKKKKSSHSKDLGGGETSRKSSFYFYYTNLEQFLKELPRIRESKFYEEYNEETPEIFNRNDLYYIRSVFVDIHLRNFVGRLSTLTTVKWSMINCTGIENEESENLITTTYFPFVIREYRSRFLHNNNNNAPSSRDPLINGVVESLDFLHSEEKKILRNLYLEVLNRIILKEEDRLKNQNKPVRNLRNNTVFRKSLFFVCLVVYLFSSGGFGVLKINNFLSLLDLSFHDAVKCFQFFVREVLGNDNQQQQFPQLEEDQEERRMNNLDVFGNNEFVKFSLKRYLIYLEEKYFNGYLFRDRRSVSRVSPFFVKKFLELTYRKVRRILLSMEVSEEIEVGRICKCVKYLVLEKNHNRNRQQQQQEEEEGEEGLIFNFDHLDQVILCSCYIILNKYNKLNEITFKDIIVHYSYDQEENRLKTPIELSKVLFRIPKFNNVIQFYNKYFIHEIKEYLGTGALLRMNESELRNEFLMEEKKQEKKRSVKKKLKTIIISPPRSRRSSSRSPLVIFPKKKKKEKILKTPTKQVKKRIAFTPTSSTRSVTPLQSQRRRRRAPKNGNPKKVFSFGKKFGLMIDLTPKQDESTKHIKKAVVIGQKRKRSEEEDGFQADMIHERERKKRKLT